MVLPMSALLVGGGVSDPFSQNLGVFLGEMQVRSSNSESMVCKLFATIPQ